MISHVLFVVGFVLLIKGADLLISGSINIAKKFNVPQIVIGLTIVSFGTSLPELLVSFISNFKGNSDLAIGNILGSNIANILLILGVSALICPLPIQRNTILLEIPFSLVATLLVGFLANASLFVEQKELSISRIDGFILLSFFLLFLAYIYKIFKENGFVNEASDQQEKTFWIKDILLIVFGIAGLFWGGKWVVAGGIKIATIFGASESLIGLTIIAVGTSLPELVASAVAAYKKNIDIAVGNAIGSNIFNILWILGISSLVKSLPFDVINNIDILMVIFSSTLLILSLVVGKRYAINRWKGVFFILTYFVYIAYLIKRG